MVFCSVCCTHSSSLHSCLPQEIKVGRSIHEPPLTRLPPKPRIVKQKKTFTERSTSRLYILHSKKQNSCARSYFGAMDTSVYSNGFGLQKVVEEYLGIFPEHHISNMSNRCACRCWTDEPQRAKQNHEDREQGSLSRQGQNISWNQHVN